MPSVSRRAFIIGGASALALAACGGGDDDDDDATQSTVSSTSTTAGGFAIARVFAPKQPVAQALRLPIALADADGSIRDDVPATITYRFGPARSEFGPAVEASRHDEGIPTPYFPLEVTLENEGEWIIEVTAGDEVARTTVVGAGPSEVPAVPAVGSQLIPLATPTTGDPRGVDPICTRNPPCPFHEQTLEEAMASGKAVALLISTPQFCQTAICGPVLDLLVDRADQHADVLAVVHAEVYTDDTARTTTEAVQAYGLAWEPSLFVAQPDGTITSRLDFTYDGMELDEVLSKVLQ